MLHISFKKKTENIIAIIDACADVSLISCHDCSRVVNHGKKIVKYLISEILTDCPTSICVMGFCVLLQYAESSVHSPVFVARKLPKAFVKSQRVAPSLEVSLPV